MRVAIAGAGALTGKTVVATGTLERFSRDEIKEAIIRHGGKAAGKGLGSTFLTGTKGVGSLPLGGGGASLLAATRPRSSPRSIFTGPQTRKC